MDIKPEQTKYDFKIVEMLEEYVKKIAQMKWEEKYVFGEPKFFVSLYNEDIDNQVMLITIRYSGIKLTEKLFPRENTGYDSLENQMTNMYNQILTIKECEI